MLMSIAIFAPEYPTSKPKRMPIPPRGCLPQLRRRLHPVAVEPVRHAVGNPHARDGLAADVARVEDVELAGVPRLVVVQDQHVAVVLRGGGATRHEARLAHAVAGALLTPLG